MVEADSYTRVGAFIDVILSAAKDLRRCFGLKCYRVVFNDDIGENRESVSREINLPEVLRFAQDDKLNMNATSRRDCLYGISKLHVIIQRLIRTALQYGRISAEKPMLCAYSTRLRLLLPDILRDGLRLTAANAAIENLL